MIAGPSNNAKTHAIKFREKKIGITADIIENERAKIGEFITESTQQTWCHGNPDNDIQDSLY